MRTLRWHALGWLMCAATCWLYATSPAEAQLGALVSPGPLARAHASLEGAASCQKCHERGRKVTAEKCLSCHAPIAQRIQLKRGVHSAVTECVTCHADHAGVDGELRPFDTAKFNHAAVTGFALDGKHAPLATRCESCHKTRSFLTATPSCSSCHTDVHKGSLGQKCQSCHPTNVAFTAARTSFNHDVTAFPLLGAHKRTQCSTCHVAASFKVPKFGACADCHKTPHPVAVSTACASCHTNDNWRTRRFDHSRTAFPLRGEHATVACESCHKQPATKVKPPSATCASCHADTHRGEFKQDCKACHAETGWARAPFDHQAGTPSHFALTDGHASLTCRTCHMNLGATATLPPARKVVDFRGQLTTCVSCHRDVHQSELGTTCDACHSSKTFAVATFTHPGGSDFYGGQHAPLSCASCHQHPAVLAAARRALPPPAPASRGVPAGLPLAATKHTQLLSTRFKGIATTCVTCHADPHRGQVGSQCESCHSVAAVKFAPDRFTHDKSQFPLAGKHRGVACAACHKTEPLPSGPGTAVRLTGIGTTCASCHADVHLGQVSPRCETCHSVETFKTAKYEHSRALSSLFVGSHKRATCQACHKTITGVFPSGRGTAVQFKVGTQCTSCHVDVHRGALGTDCGRCHKPGLLER